MTAPVLRALFRPGALQHSTRASQTLLDWTWTQALWLCFQSRELWLKPLHIPQLEETSLYLVWFLQKWYSHSSLVSEVTWSSRGVMKCLPLWEQVRIQTEQFVLWFHLQNSPWSGIGIYKLPTIYLLICNLQLHYFYDRESYQCRNCYWYWILLLQQWSSLIMIFASAVKLALLLMNNSIRI